MPEKSKVSVIIQQTYVGGVGVNRGMDNEMCSYEHDGNDVRYLTFLLVQMFSSDAQIASRCTGRER